MVDYRLLGPRLQAPLGAPPFHTWTFPDGTLWTAFHQTPSGYLLRFPELADFEVSALKENLDALLADLKKAKPAASKGQYVKKLTVSSTMGPGVSVDRTSIDA